VCLLRAHTLRSTVDGAAQLAFARNAFDLATDG
jgi:hypothetical protein